MAERLVRIALTHIVEAQEIERFCYEDDQPCAKLKRAAKAVAEAIAEPTAEPEPEASPKKHHHHEHVQTWCYMSGQTCSKHKRALDKLNAVVSNI